MKLKMAEMAARIQQKAAANPPDPETVRKIKDFMDGLGKP